MNINQMIAVVQAYIHHRKGVEVQINMNQFNDPINIFSLHKAYTTAVNYFEENNGIINFI